MISVQVDMREFNRALKELALTSSRTVTQEVAAKALHLAKTAPKHTKKASADKIASQLGQIGTTLKRRRKDGRLVKNKRIFGGEGTFAARIINAKRAGKGRWKNSKWAGESPLFGAEMEKAVKKFITARTRSTSFIASGWKWAIADMSRIVGYVDRRAKGKQTKPPKGERMGRVVRHGSKYKPNIQISNTALDNDEGRRGAIPIAEAGLVKAIQIVTADMKQKLEQRLAKALKKHNAR